MTETGKKSVKAGPKPGAETKPKAEAKTKVPAKPKVAKASAQTKAASEVPSVADKVQAVTPPHVEIARLAQRFWVERGHQDGHAEQDWLRAERELMKIAS